MTKPRLKLFLAATIISVLVGILWVANAMMVGRVLDSYRGVDVYGNGFIFFRSYGQNYAEDGYYFGRKWQCVEFVKRFYYKAHGLRMPYVWGNAKDFFDPQFASGALNLHRGMIQYANGGDKAPAPDDLLVFTDTAYGHVAIVTAVDQDSLEVVQQNIFGHTRQKFELKREDGHYTITSPRTPAGWLRAPPPAAKSPP